MDSHSEQKSHTNYPLMFSDLNNLGRLYISGKDSLDLLNRLTTNDLSDFDNFSSVSTVMTNGDAKVIDYLTLAAGEESGVWCVTSEGRSSAVSNWLDMYTFGEDITVTECTQNTGHIIILSSWSDQFKVMENAGFKIPQIAQSSSNNPYNAIVFPSSFGRYKALQILIPKREDLSHLKALLYEACINELTEDEFEELRIFEGVPMYSKEFGEFNNPLEARLTGVISETKGCYTGQEVIARLQTYQKIQRQLMSFDSSEIIEVGSSLFTKEGTGVGTVTSAYVNGKATRGLALVSTKYATNSQVLTSKDEAQFITLTHPFHAIATEPVN